MKFALSRSGRGRRRLIKKAVKEKPRVSRDKYSGPRALNWRMFISLEASFFGARLFPRLSGAGMKTIPRFFFELK
jgi:hypothetical protein